MRYSRQPEVKNPQKENGGNKIMDKFLLENVIKYKDNAVNLALLADIYSRNGVIPFVGAGMSACFSYKLWGDFLLSACKNQEETVEVKQMLVNYKYEEAAEYLYNLDKENFKNQLMNEYGAKEIDEKIMETAAVALLPKIFNGPIITTNFDKVIEKAYEWFGKSISIVSNANLEDMLTHLSKRDEFLFKIHGDINSFNSIVITKSDYECQYSHNDKFKECFYCCIKPNTILFLGCSLNQDRTVYLMNKILENQNQNKHYAFMASPAMSSDGFLIQDVEKQYQEEEIRQRLDKFHIIPIWFPMGAYDCIKDLLYKLPNPNELVFSERSLYLSMVRQRSEAQLGIKKYIDLSVGDGTALTVLLPQLTKNKRLMLLGEPGSGKTTTIKKFALDLSDFCIKDVNAVIPLLIELSEWEEESFEQFLIDVWKNSYSMSGKLKDFIKKGQIILLLDGLNEVKNKIDEKADELFVWLLHHETTYAVITCRSAEYNYLNQNSKIKRHISCIELKPMNLEQSTGFIKNYLGNNADPFLSELSACEAGFSTYNIKKDIAMTDIFAQIRNTPFLLSSLINYYEENHQISLNPYVIVEMLVKSMLKRTYILKRYGEIVAQKVVLALAELALVIIDRKLGISIAYQEALSVVGKENMEIAAYAELIDISTNVVKYKHQIWLEYFASVALQKRNISDIIPRSSVHFMTYSDKGYDPLCWNFYDNLPPRWQVPVLFLLGYNSTQGQDIEEQILHIAEIDQFIAIKCLKSIRFLEPDIIKCLTRKLISRFAGEIGELSFLRELAPLIDTDDLIELVDADSDKYEPTEAVIILLAERTEHAQKISETLLKLLEAEQTRHVLSRGIQKTSYIDTSIAVRLKVRIYYTLGALADTDALFFLLPELSNNSVSTVSGFANCRPISLQAFCSSIRVAMRNPVKAAEILVDHYYRNWMNHVEILLILDKCQLNIPLDFYMSAMDDCSSNVRGTAMEVMIKKFPRHPLVINRLKDAIYDENAYSVDKTYTDNIEDLLDNCWHSPYSYYTYDKIIKKYISIEALKCLIDWKVDFNNDEERFLYCYALLYTHNSWEHTNFETENLKLYICKFQKLNKCIQLSDLGKKRWEIIHKNKL